MTFNYDFEYAYYFIASIRHGGTTSTDLLRFDRYLLLLLKSLKTNFNLNN